jgi:hypothetical protein
LLKHLKLTFGKLVTDVRDYKTPAAPTTGITRPGDNDPVLNAEDQKLYHSGIGMLLYLVKHS